MRTLLVSAAVFASLTALGWTVYYDDPNPWGGWFAPAWFASLGAFLIILSIVTIVRAVDEIANPTHCFTTTTTPRRYTP
ncbi:hypothetical protein SEA_MULAN_46 [Mycobacterium phage Mulan]|uniref:Uncharacterized protein n=1 Tax=Mycobacterium phage Mulan TaxID=2301607 RepID=A0A385UGD1_9CAUD|nr:hypothetical protein SEA_MULAN_46 [Mycobacterium phage Mulan]